MARRLGGARPGPRWRLSGRLGFPGSGGLVGPRTGAAAVARSSRWGASSLEAASLRDASHGTPRTFVRDREQPRHRRRIGPLLRLGEKVRPGPRAAGDRRDLLSGPHLSPLGADWAAAQG